MYSPIHTSRFLALSMICTVLSVGFSGEAEAVLYVSNVGSGAIQTYDEHTGTLVNGALLAGSFASPQFILVDGNSLYVADTFAQNVGKYNATSGATINANFVPYSSPATVAAPTGLAISGSSLFVANQGDGLVGRFSLINGTPGQSAFISTGASDELADLAIIGNTLYVANQTTDSVMTFNSLTGALINAHFITGIQDPQGLAVSGANLFVTSFTNGTVGAYSASSGAAVNANLITGLNHPWDVIVSGNELYVSETFANRVGLYNATTGAAINPSFISVSNPGGMAIPEPSSSLLISLGGLSIYGIRRRRDALAE